MNKNIRDHISNKLKEPISNSISVPGGDISEAYRVETSHQLYFLKVNTRANAMAMFTAEKMGLETIAKTNTIATPKVIDVDKVNDVSYLLLEYIEPKSASEKDLEKLGHQLAQLHSNLSMDSLFGFDANNFIGSLSQSNIKHTTWPAFYIEERIIPQLQSARSNNLLKNNDIPKTEILYERFTQYCEAMKPSLVHGDLWGGNYLISKNGVPYLIDPAIYYGHSEIDIAMSKLFGGFSNTFYDAYQEVIPFDKFTNVRIDIYQLYYLIVHLNLFGGSYYGSVKRILDKYFY